MHPLSDMRATVRQKQAIGACRISAQPRHLLGHRDPKAEDPRKEMWSGGDGKWKGEFTGRRSGKEAW